MAFYSYLLSQLCDLLHLLKIEYYKCRNAYSERISYKPGGILNITLALPCLFCAMHINIDDLFLLHLLIFRDVSPISVIIGGLIGENPFSFIQNTSGFGLPFALQFKTVALPLL